HYANAVDLYHSAIRERPSSVEAWTELAEAQFHGNPMRGRPIAESRDAFEQVLKLEPTHFAATMHLARLAAARRDTVSLNRYTTAALEGKPDGTHRVELLLLRYLALGDNAARESFLASPRDNADLDALWRTA